MDPHRVRGDRVCCVWPGAHLELVVLFGIHYADFAAASTGALGNGTADLTCVGAAPNARVRGEYGTDTAPALYEGFNIFGWPTQIGGSEVACYDADDASGGAVPRRDLQRLVAASVHPLRKAAVDAGADASDELRATYFAARDAALGVGSGAATVGFWQAVEALQTLAPPPRTCAEIYDAAPSPAATATAVVAAARDAASVACANTTTPAGATFANAVNADDAARAFTRTAGHRMRWHGTSPTSKRAGSAATRVARSASPP